MINSAYDVLIGFSPLPAKFITAVGLGMFGVSLLVLFYLVLTWPSPECSLDGRA